MTMVLPSTNPLLARASMEPRVPSSNSMVEACCSSPMCMMPFEPLVRCPRSDNSSAAEADAIRRTPKRSRFITNRICKPIEKSQAYAPRVYHSQWANHVEPNTAVYQVLAYLRSRGTLGVQNFGTAHNAG